MRSYYQLQGEYPLDWPAGWKRCKTPSFSRFKKHSMQRVLLKLNEELRMTADDNTHAVITSNVELRLDGLPYANRRSPDDTGVAVYFELNGRSTVLACDSWSRVECNVHAIAKHLEAMRGQMRWGVGSLDQAFTGYAALPEKACGTTWWQTLGLEGQPSTSIDVNRAYRRQAKTMHPDVGGDEGQWRALQAAREQGLQCVMRSSESGEGEG